ncbi:MAG: hypothetical protein LBE71_05735 [Dysgonamonadaceae bacterium]|jgi:hypothetical protein|nr:hypothetical protein [Dysgonamonadaceae bacterium]
MRNAVNHTVKVIIPVYKNNLNNDEALSLQQCCKILSRYPIVIVKPESLDISAIIREYPSLGTENFDDHFFRNIEGYNELMVSPLFYERFLDCEYILIYQLDAYVFRDELEDWCCKSYDYIGAPWIRREKSLQNCWLFRKLYRGPKAIRLYDDCLYNAGNGGFSLRRTHLFYEIVCTAENVTDPVPEDIFWSRIMRNDKHRVPDYKEALLFSFDRYPAECFQITGKIPFGCHAWNRKKMYRFWKNIIKRKSQHLSDV